MTSDASTAGDPVSLAYRILRLLRVAVAILVGLATVAATLGWV